MKKLFLSLTILSLYSCSALKPIVPEELEQKSVSNRAPASTSESVEAKEVPAEIALEDDAKDLLDDKEKTEIQKRSFLADDESFEIQKEIQALKGELDELDPQTISGLRELDEDELKALKIKEELLKEKQNKEIAFLSDNVDFDSYIESEELKKVDGSFEVLKTDSPQMMATLDKKVETPAPGIFKEDKIIKRSIASVEEQKPTLTIGPKNLLYAAKKGFSGTIRYLIVHKRIDVNTVDDRTGKTALMVAIENKRIGNVRALLNFKADKSIEDANGMNALDYAKKSNHPAIIKMLENAAP